MADKTYHDHTLYTSMSTADEIPFWKVADGKAGRISLLNYIASVLAAGSDVTTIASSATPQPDIGTTKTYIITAQAVNASMLAPSGSPSEAQVLIYRIKDNGGARTLSWASAFRGIGLTIPTVTVAGKWLYLGYMYNATDAKWDLIALAQQ